MSTYQFRENGDHYNGGAVFFGYGYAAIGEPRLYMMRKWYRQGERRGKTEDSFHVDGTRCDSYEAAMEALKTPPVFSAEELAALKLIGDEYARHRTSDNVLTLHALGKKGTIEWQKGECRRTDAGRRIAAEREMA